MRLIIKSKTLIDCIHPNPLTDYGIFVENGEIKSLIPGIKLHCIDKDAEILNFGDSTVLPGLIDSHVHLVFNSKKNVVDDVCNSSSEQLTLRVATNAFTALASGVTTVRDCGSKDLIVLKVKEAINRGEIIGPRIIQSGMPLTVPGGHLSFIGKEVNSIEEIRESVRDLIRKGSDFIKVAVTGGGMTTGTNIFVPQFSEEELSVIVQEAHRLGEKVSGHVSGTKGIDVAVKAGIDIIDHCTWATQDGVKVDKNIAKCIVDRGIAICATIGVLNNRPLEIFDEYLRSIYSMVRAKRRETIQEMLDMGVKMVIGTDAGIEDVGFGTFAEALIDAVNNLKLPPMQAILSATKKSAEVLGLDNEIGSIEPGKRADLLVVKGNPLEDICSLRHVKMVFKDGIKINREGSFRSKN